MMVPLGARVGRWGLVECTDVRNKEQSSTRSAAAQGTEAVPLGLEVCTTPWTVVMTGEIREGRA